MSIALLWSAVATAAAAPVLQPTTPWDVDYGETQCTAGRSYGDASAPIVLGIVPSIGGDTYKLIVSVPRSGPIYAQELDGKVDFGGPEIKTWLLHFGGTKAKLTIDQFRIPAAEIEQARTAKTLRLHSGQDQEFDFALSAMPAMLDALRACTADLQRYWNFDAKAAGLKSAPVGSLQGIIDSDDYPMEAMDKDQQGKVEYQLLVDETGAVAGCDVRVRSGVPVLDAMGCAVIERKARFKPAIGSNGKPARSVTGASIDWVIG